MKEKLILFIFLFLSFTLQAQIENIVSKYDLPNQVLESSGLLFYKGKLITHNDSGDSASLYELDTINGTVTRIIQISNASNIDWESITQDENYIYIGDFGNNNGNRQDLSIYRISKSDYDTTDTINADKITFSYEDQTDFSVNPYNHDFDAEAFVAYNEQLIVFTKNWATNTVKAYSIPKTIGNHSAKNIGNYNSNGLVTDAAYNTEDNSFLLCGYTKDGNPILWYLKNITIQKLFNGPIERTDISANIGIASQIEGITHIQGGKYFLSRERVHRTINGNQIVLNEHLFRFDNASFSTLSINDLSLKKPIIFPNPSKTNIRITGVKTQSFSIYNVLGIELRAQKNSSNQIHIGELPTGTYILKIVTIDNQTILTKFIKN